MRLDDLQGLSGFRPIGREPCCPTWHVVVEPGTIREKYRTRALNGEKGTDLFFALCRTPLASPLHAHAELAVDLINKPLASSELPALQGLSNEHQL